MPNDPISRRELLRVATVAGGGMLLAANVGYAPRTMGHYIENTGDTELQFLEVFKGGYYLDLALSQWVTHTPPTLVKAHLNIDQPTLDAVPKDKVVVVPG